MWHGRSVPYAHLPLYDALPGPRSSRVGRLPLVRQQQQQCCCYLIYNLPVLWRSGAAARWSRLHTPVETLTPPEIPQSPLGSRAPLLQRGACSPLNRPYGEARDGGLERRPLRGVGPLGVCRWILFQYSIDSCLRVLRFCDIWSGAPLGARFFIMLRSLQI